jgi:hypothetical protein
MPESSPSKWPLSLEGAVSGVDSARRRRIGGQRGVSGVQGHGRKKQTTGEKSGKKLHGPHPNAFETHSQSLFCGSLIGLLADNFAVKILPIRG